jgi:hypothetical protein
MAKRPPPPSAETSSLIDWPRLLVGRPCPPPGWWVSLAIERQCGTVELRASAVVALLAPPLHLDPGRAPYLMQLPRLAREWIPILRDHDAFICLGPDSDAMHVAGKLLLITRACCEAMKETRTSGEEDALVPELWAMYREAAQLVEALEAAGIPLSAYHNRLSPEVKAQLLRRAAEIEARTGRALMEPLDPTCPSAKAPAPAPAPAVTEAPAPPKARKPARRQSSKTKEAPAIESFEPMPGWFF